MGIIVGISGRSKSGKSTAANFLIDNFNFIRRGFADGLRACVAEYFGYSNQLLNEHKDLTIPELSRTPRSVLLEVGKNMRQIDPDVWIKYWERGVQSIRDSYPKINVVVDDLRFKNEFHWLRSQGAYLIRVNRAVSEVTTEQSEVDLDDYAEQGLFDTVLENRGTLQDLYTNLSAVVSNALIRETLKKTAVASSKAVSISGLASG